MSRYPRELAVYEAACSRLGLAHHVATGTAKSDIAAARELFELLFHQCGAYHAALRDIAKMADPAVAGGAIPYMDILNVLENLDQPI